MQNSRFSLDKTPWICPAPLRSISVTISFAPLQEEIIRDSLAGQDVLRCCRPAAANRFASSCRLVRDGLTVVVSPLISLMKDQVDALQASGIPATFLNSVDRDEAKARCAACIAASTGALCRAGATDARRFLESALNWNVAQLAIDEAHCISEWGHDFRPEYRQLKSCGNTFPTCRSWRSPPPPPSACARTSSRT